MTEEATENVDGCDMFVQAQLLKKSPAILASMTTRSVNIYHQEYEKKPNVIHRHHIPLHTPDVQATEHQTKSFGSEHQQWTDHDQNVETEMPTIHGRIKKKGTFKFDKRFQLTWKYHRQHLLPIRASSRQHNSNSAEGKHN